MYSNIGHDLLATATDEFENCWHAAINHLQSQVDYPLGWYKVNLEPPFLEHMSLVMGNQLVFIMIEDVDKRLDTPGNLEGLFLIAGECKGHACVMPMRNESGEWVAAEEGWGLLDARTRKPVNPLDLVTDELIEMSDWELHKEAVQTIKKAMVENGAEFIASQNNPIIEPSLWIHTDDGPVWFVIRAVRYPLKKADEPSITPDLRALCDRHIEGSSGFFVSVLFTSMDETFDARAEENGNIAPIYRGKKFHYQCSAVEPITKTGEEDA